MNFGGKDQQFLKSGELGDGDGDGDLFGCFFVCLFVCLFACFAMMREMVH